MRTRPLTLANLLDGDVDRMRRGKPAQSALLDCPKDLSQELWSTGSPDQSFKFALGACNVEKLWAPRSGGDLGGSRS